MSAKYLVLFLMLIFMFASFSTVTYAGEGVGKQEAALSKKIDTKDLSGVDLLIVNLYNNDRILYAVVVTLVMATIGTIMAFGTDLVLKFFGMNVTRISHTE